MRHMGEYFPAKTWEHLRTFPNYQNRARCKKDLKDSKHNSVHLGRKYVPWTLSVPCSSQLLLDKYPWTNILAYFRPKWRLLFIYSIYIAQSG